MSKNAFKNEMTPKERVTALWEGRPYDRVPCNPMLGAHAARVTGVKISEYHLSAKKMAEAQIAAYKTYGHDEIGVMAILGIVHSVGGKVVYLDEGSPYITGQLIKDAADLERLTPPVTITDEHLKVYFSATEILLEKLGKEVPVTISIRAPFSTAATLRGVDAFLRDLYYQPEFAHQILRFALASMIPVIKAATQLGAIIAISDPIASGSLVSPKHYKEYAFPYAQELIAAIKQSGGKSPTLHICGNTKKIWSLMADTGAGALSIEDKIDLAEAKRIVGERVIIAGNIRPTEAMYQGKPEDVVADVKKGLSQAYDNPKGYIVQMGCALPIDTPPANIHALMGAVRKYGQYPFEPELFQ